MRSYISQTSAAARERGAALIIVLAFVVLLTGLTFAYFSRSATDRQLSRASYNDAAADLLARSALDIVLGDFRQEITNGSTTITPNGVTIYKPNANANIRPMPCGTPGSGKTAIPNLIRISSNSFTISPPGITSRASNVNSTAASFNNRSVTAARWNSHLLMPLKTAGSTTDTTPVTSFNPPDWVLVTRQGPVPFNNWDSSVADRTSNNYVVGRYAYAVYDEGGLLDMNVAGYPDQNSAGVGATPAPSDIGRKGIVTFADLAGGDAASTTSYPYIIMSHAAINKFLLFRNYATTDSTQNLGNSVYFTSVCNTAATTSGKGFLNYYLGADGTNGKNCASSTEQGTTQDFGQVNPTTSNASGAIRTDQLFLTRQELIKFRSSAGVATTDALQYLGTFSRNENKPTWPLMQGTPLFFPARFYMKNFADVVRNPTNASGVLSNFGLHWNAAGYWEYWGAGGAGVASAIPAITDPSKADFFQILNYALHGTTAADSANIATTLALGAAIIDEYDSESPPVTTRIDYSLGSVYGMENTPPDPARPSPAPVPPSGYYSLNRPFRNVGELGYAFKQGSTRSDQTIDFSTAAMIDAPILDFTFNTADPRSGIVSINTQQLPVVTAVLQRGFTNEASANYLGQTDPKSDPSRSARNAATTIISTASAAPALSRADAARLASAVGSSPFGTTDETQETITRAIAELGQTRTWGLLIDVVAQTGHYVPSSSDLTKFIVDGEKRYWLHIDIDRFDRTIVGQQLEEVFEQ